MRRLFPVPFRLIQDDQQFKKWQWITARVERANNDNRPESHKIFIDTINCEEPPLSTVNGWIARREWINKIPYFTSFDAVEKARQDHGITLALLQPKTTIGLDLKRADSSEWTDEEKAKLLQMQYQGNLFDETEAKSIRLLRKLPHDFHYRYECESVSGTTAHRHKLVDWEVGALYWNVTRRHGEGWEQPFRDKLERDLPSHDLMFLLGTMHRFPDQWLIVSLVYPPKRTPSDERQIQLI